LQRFNESVKLIKRTTQILSKKGIVNRELKFFFKPIDYVRTIELPVVLNLSKIITEKERKLKILDISSPQILSASLAQISNNWSIIYINPFEPELHEMEKIKRIMNLKNITTVKVDVTNQNILDELPHKFDYIFSSSVIEHIHPENGGDSIAVKNVVKLLDENGLFIFSVPFYKKGFNEYKSGDVYSIKGKKNMTIFFQRFYDEERLYNQIIKPSGLYVQSKMFLGENFYYPNNINKRFAQLMSSKISSVLFGKLFYLLSKVFMIYSENHAELQKPYIVVASLRKPK
jgi:SAM-dependent methyltransferase